MPEKYGVANFAVDTTEILKNQNERILALEKAIDILGVYLGETLQNAKFYDMVKQERLHEKYLKELRTLIDTTNQDKKPSQK